jgi:shikimate kinase
MLERHLKFCYLAYNLTMKNERGDSGALATNKKTGNAAKKSAAKGAVNLPTRVALIGFMGTGKSTIAAHLAEKIGGDSFDLDDFIETSENRSISQIIENFGEAVFREIETEHLREALKTPSARVVALGGGAWTIEENRNVLRAQGFTSVWLDAPFDLCWRRIRQNTAVVRPLARRKVDARRLFETRRAVYALADLRVAVAPENAPVEIAEEIIKNLKTFARRQKILTKSG